MNRRERVQAALQGRRVDRVPFTVWRHFYFQSQTAEGLVQATLSFYRQYEPDMIVLPAGPYYMAQAWDADVRSFSTDDMAPYIASPIVTQVAEWRGLTEPRLGASSLRREIEAVRQIQDQLEKDTPLVVPLYSPLMTANMLCNGRIVEDVRSFSNDLRAGLRTIATTTREYALACLEAGADGFLFTTDLASRDLMRSREYRDFGLGFDLEVLDELSEAEIRILCLGGTHLFFDLVDRYPVQAVCWETWRADPSMASAARQVRSALMGGINPRTFVGGSVGDIREQIGAAIAQTGGWRLLIAPSGPVPPDSRSELLASMSDVIVQLQG